MAFMNFVDGKDVPQKSTLSPNDIFVWPDDTWCYRDEFERGEWSYMSDDFIVLQEGSVEHDLMESGEATYDSLVAGWQKQKWELTDPEIESVGREAAAPGMDADPAAQASRPVDVSRKTADIER
jgi:hypothetical protein